MSTFLALVLMALPCATGEVWGYIHPWHGSERVMICLDTPDGETLITANDAEGAFRFEVPITDGEYRAYVPGGGEWLFTWTDSRDGATVGPLKVDIYPNMRYMYRRMAFDRSK